MYGRLQLRSHEHHPALARAQCGLCAHYGARYRLRTRLLAGRDPSLLLLLAEALAAPVAAAAPDLRVRCPLRVGLARRPALAPDAPALAAIAALQVVLAAEKLRDDVRDRDRALAGLAARLLARDLASAEATLAAERFPTAALRAALAAQAALEASAHADLDQLAAPTGDALALALGWLGDKLGHDAATAERLATFGRRLGRALYMVDALEDLPRDVARGVFNPLAAALGPFTPARQAYLAASFAGLTESLARAFDALPLQRHHAALREATVENLSARGHAALREHA